MTAADLLEKARAAKPDVGAGKGIWNKVFPAFRALHREQGFTSRAAVQWLVDQGEIPEEHARRALASLRSRLLYSEGRKGKKNNKGE